MKYLKEFDTETNYLAYRDSKDYLKPNVSLCVEHDVVYYNYSPKPKPNGHDYVDLGLPSGTLWATMNVGASKPSDYGLYFQWGDVQGYTFDQVGTGDGQKKFSWADYKWNPNGDGKTFTKYNTTDATLELDLEDDAAHANMGGSWHMPTPTQISELLSNTTNTWTTQDGVNGRLFTSKTDTSKTIFIPAAGGAWDGSVGGRGSGGLVWSSMLSSSYVSYGQYLYFNSGNASLNYYCSATVGFPCVACLVRIYSSYHPNQFSNMMLTRCAAPPKHRIRKLKNKKLVHSSYGSERTY